MKIAIHDNPGSFSDRWILYCQENKIPFKLVNCNDSSILKQIEDCNGLMWHWSHGDYRAQNFARQLIISIEKTGKKVFPDSATCWHYDDKIGQKYLLEAIQAPLVPAYTFYDEAAALDWLNSTTFPKVFKLRGGAGSSNVRLVISKHHARRLVKRSFNKGFSLNNAGSGLKQRLWVLRRDGNIKAVFHLLKGLTRLLFPKKELKLLPRQKGYVYFQDFIPNNNFDDRIVIIGERAIAIRRYNRKSDFRASGSGILNHDPNLFNLNSINIAFDVAGSLKTQSLAFDFIYSAGKPLIVEISYAFAQGWAYDQCPGYWDKELNWHDKPINPQKFIVEDFIKQLI